MEPNGIKSSPMVWWVLWKSGDLVQRVVDGDLGLLKVHISDLFTRLGKYLHLVVVGRRDAVKGWRIGLDKNIVVAPTSGCDLILLVACY